MSFIGSVGGNNVHSGTPPSNEVARGQEVSVEVTTPRPTPEQLADAVLDSLKLSTTDREALKAANGGTDIRDTLIADFRRQNINDSALTYIGGKYAGKVRMPEEMRRNLVEWAKTDGDAPSAQTESFDTTARRRGEVQMQGAYAKHKAELALRKQEAKQQIVTDMLGTGVAKMIGAAVSRDLPKTTSLLTETMPPLVLGTAIVAGVAATLDKGLELGVERQMETARDLPPIAMANGQDEPPLIDTAQQPKVPAVPTDEELPKGELVLAGEALPPPATASPAGEAKPSEMQPAPQNNPPSLDRIIPPLIVSSSLGKLAVDKAHEMDGAAKPLVLTPTGDKDPAAADLAARIGGTPSVKIDGYGNREFDVVSDEYIGQTTGSVNATELPSNYLNPKKKAQIRETLRVAAETGRTALFEFTAGTPSTEVTDFLRKNAERAGAGYEIVVRTGR